MSDIHTSVPNLGTNIFRDLVNLRLGRHPGHSLRDYWALLVRVHGSLQGRSFPLQRWLLGPEAENLSIEYDYRAGLGMVRRGQPRKVG